MMLQFSIQTNDFDDRSIVAGESQSIPSTHCTSGVSSMDEVTG
jgi:hypothetical protein